MKNFSALFLLFTLLACTEKSAKNQALLINLTEQPDEPELFGAGTISTALNERDLAISTDGTEIIYSLGNYDQSKRILVSVKKTDETWSPPEMLHFSGEHDDIEPFYSPDGNRLFFVSNRPIDSTSTEKNYNIWFAEKTQNGWGNAKEIGAPINTAADEFYPSVASNGNLYFTAIYENGIGSEDIYMSEFKNGEYLQPVSLDTAINSKSYEFNAFVSPDETMLIFSSYGRSDGLGGGDLYVSKKDGNNNWLPAVNLGHPINSNKLDYCPFVDYPRNNFYFTSNRKKENNLKSNSIEEFIDATESPLNGMSNIYKISLNKINAD